MLSLADFHRGQGTLQSELERAEALPGEKGEAWRAALYRAAGNLEAARDSAAAAGEERRRRAANLKSVISVPQHVRVSGLAVGLAEHAVA